MNYDQRLEELKVAQNLAFAAKQDSLLANQKAWDELVQAKDELNEAYGLKQAAFNEQERIWTEVKDVARRNNDRIAYLTEIQEYTYQRMKDAFKRASLEYKNKNGIAAKVYSAQGQEYKSESTRHADERRQLDDERKLAIAKRIPSIAAFNNAKLAFVQAKQKYDEAKAEYLYRNKAYSDAKSDFDASVKAFHARLSALKIANSSCAPITK